MATPRNLIWFQSDNHARGWLGCYGHPLADTPTLDRIAERGTRFANAYAASALCCPARAALITGRYVHQIRCWDNAIVYDGSVPGWAHRIRDAGHRVSSVGKLHFRSSDDDNGFTEELAAMHILDGKGGVSMLLRGIDDEQVNAGQWALYAERSGVGRSDYQDYDREVTARAVAWLRRQGRRERRSWLLHVSYASAHPPFAVPERLYRRYRDADIPLPPLWSPGQRPQHPAIAHLRHIMGWRDLDPELLRRISAGYLALITHLDEQIAEVLAAAADLDLLDDARILYTSDHGEMCGSHGLLGKCNLYEGSIGVPLLMAGPDIPRGRVVAEPVSHVDLFPTLIEAFGLAPVAEDAELPGRSLWSALSGRRGKRPVFAEYHAAGSKTGSFMLRQDRCKLIHHVDMPPQLFDLEGDPYETEDVAADPRYGSVLAGLQERLRAICNPRSVDALAKADQRAKMEHWGGRQAILNEGMLVITPPPGVAAHIEPTP